MKAEEILQESIRLIDQDPAADLRHLVAPFEALSAKEQIETWARLCSARPIGATEAGKNEWGLEQHRTIHRHFTRGMLSVATAFRIPVATRCTPSK